MYYCKFISIRGMAMFIKKEEQTLVGSESG